MVVSGMSEEHLDGLSRNLVHTFMFSSMDIIRSAFLFVHYQILPSDTGAFSCHVGCVIMDFCLLEKVYG